MSYVQYTLRNRLAEIRADIARLKASPPGMCINRSLHVLENYELDVVQALNHLACLQAVRKPPPPPEQYYALTIKKTRKQK